jgi:hypothetical protein
MMGEREATIVAVKPFDLHGMRYYDLAVRFDDGSVENPRLGAESVPGDLQPGDRVMATRVANMVISLRRP